MRHPHHPPPNYFSFLPFKVWGSKWSSRKRCQSAHWFPWRDGPTPSFYLPRAQFHGLAMRSPAARRSSGTRPASCSSPRQTQTASCPPLCWPSECLWMEKRAGGSRGYSAELKQGDKGTTVKIGPRWKLTSGPKHRNHPCVLICSVNILHTRPWAGHQERKMSAITCALGDLTVQTETVSSRHPEARKTVTEKYDKPGRG